MDANMARDKVIPVRLSEDELELVDGLAAKAGLPRTEIFRRAYRLLAREYPRTGNLGVIFDGLAEGDVTLKAPRKRAAKKRKATAGKGAKK